MRETQDGSGELAVGAVRDHPERMPDVTLADVGVPLWRTLDPARGSCGFARDKRRSLGNDMLA
jgi:hypothetical protein